MNLRFYMDPESGSPHIHRHQVEEAEVQDILSNPGEDRPGREGARIAAGQTRQGRYLRVIYVPDPRGPFVITAYELTGKSLLAYRRRQRRMRGKR